MKELFLQGSQIDIFSKSGSHLCNFLYVSNAQNVDVKVVGELVLYLMIYKSQPKQSQNTLLANPNVFGLNYYGI